MSHSSSINFPKRDVLLNRENSLPTYDEATEKVAPGEFGSTAPSAPSASSAPLPTIRQGEFGFVDPSAPLQPHDHGRTTINYQYPTVPQSAHREQDVERGITDTSMLRHEDPIVREMAQTVLAECRRAKEKREMKLMMNVFGFVIGIVVVIVIIAVGGSRHR